MESKLTYITDDKRHLVCLPYSIDNLHQMAEELNIGRHWFHKDHYDVPKRREFEIREKCLVVSPRDIVRIKNGTYKPE